MITAVPVYIDSEPAFRVSGSPDALRALSRELPSFLDTDMPRKADASEALIWTDRDGVARATMLEGIREACWQAELELRVVAEERRLCAGCGSDVEDGCYCTGYGTTTRGRPSQDESRRGDGR